MKKYTTEPFFTSPLVNYLPASKNVPTPEAVLGGRVGKDAGATRLGRDRGKHGIHGIRCACYSEMLEYNPRHNGQEESEAGQQQEEDKTRN
jgi:hypothetical protein